MRLRDTIQSAFVNLLRRPVRTVLSSIGVAVGVLTMVAMISLGIGMQHEMRRQFETLGLEKIQVQPRDRRVDETGHWIPIPVRQTPITDADIARWRGLPGVTDVQGYIHPEQSVPILLRQPESPESAHPVMIELGWGLRDPLDPVPTPLVGAETVIQEGTLILSLSAAQAISLTGTPEDLLRRPVQIVLESPRGETQVFDFTIAGVLSFPDPVVVLTAADTAAINGWWFNQPDWLAQQGYDHALITTQSIDTARQLVQPLSNEGFEVTSIELLYILSNRSFRIMQVMLGSIGGLALLVASIGVMNTLAMAIFERTREIGVLKALGATNRAIRRLFIFEAGMIGLLGGVVGSFVGWLISLGLNQLAIRVMIEAELPPLKQIFMVTWELVGVVIGFAVLISTLAGLFPALRAARLAPVTALSHER